MMKGMIGRMVALACAAVFLGGCMTTAEEQNAAGQFIGGLAGGLAGGLIGSGKILPGTAVAVAGAAVAGSVGGGTGAPGGAQVLRKPGTYRGKTIPFGNIRVPDTPECREMIAYSRPGRDDRLADRFIWLYNRCLDSAPESAMSRKNRCAPHKYRIGKGHPPRMQCGPS